MTPGARIAAAIEVLGEVGAGAAAEQALTRWARRSRFAGSKDRAAIRDHVFDVMRQKRSAAHFGRGETPRALMIGLLRQQGVDPDTLFTGDGHAPAPLSDAERAAPAPPTARGILWNLPDWLIPEFERSLGDGAEAAAMALQARAPVFLRVNRARTDPPEAMRALAAEGIGAEPNPLCDTALTVTTGARSVRNSRPYRDGLVELQDAASQAVVSALPPGGKILDYCAGGGGKALALAAMPGTEVFAHDIDPRRMSDLPDRAARAGVTIRQVDGAAAKRAAPYDVVLCDAPCSGSGAWRRAAEGKWRLTPEMLRDLNDLQDDILERASALVAGEGTLAYATCSVLRGENEERVAAFLERQPGWTCRFERRFEIGPSGDGFYTAHLMRAT